jgi:uncharacterized protein (TIGR02118 family)
MFKVSVMYPNQEGGNFDFEYYKMTHMNLVKKHLTPYGLIDISVEKGISGGGGEPAPYICIGCLFFETKDGYQKGITETGHLLRGDIVNYTNIKPIRQISQII